MKLYYSPGACSLSPHIVAREAKLPVEISKVSFGSDGRVTEEGEDFYQVNPKGGYVPALRLDSGEVLAEGVAIIQYLADQSSVALTPEKGTMPYYRMLEWLTYISSEIHKGFSPLYNPMIGEEQKKAQIEKIFGRLAFVDVTLGEHAYLVSDEYTLPDAYLYTILRWTKKFEMDLSPFPNIVAFMARVDGREAVQTALKEEGIDSFVA